MWKNCSKHRLVPVVSSFVVLSDVIFFNIYSAHSAALKTELDIKWMLSQKGTACVSMCVAFSVEMKIGEV